MGVTHGVETLTFDEQLRPNARPYEALARLDDAPERREILLRRAVERSEAVAEELLGATPEVLRAATREEIAARGRLIVRAHFASKPVMAHGLDEWTESEELIYPSPIWSVSSDGSVRRGLVALSPDDVTKFFRAPLVSHGTAALGEFLVETMMRELRDPVRLLARIVNSIEFFTDTALPVIAVDEEPGPFDFIISATLAHIIRVVPLGDLDLVEDTLAEDSGAHEVPMLELIRGLDDEMYRNCSAA